ncbi:acyltransferase family protein [Campylobacter californiensis]|uniref:acyltransferase family protein n=1 Tax=Campylobacter californiensis TaxID=1032243 RepID=UPI0014761730|nr:acyltransferase [Campylobacter sp. RM12916]MBE3609017.1 acyltransferase [Campylobacter sp. RM12916]
MNKFNLDYIDSMRGIAILMVLAVHFTIFLEFYNIEHLPLGIENILRSGKYGVALFFIVSAFALFRSLDVRQECGYRAYYFRRFFRIAPAYYLVLIVVFSISDGQMYYMEDIESVNSIFNLFAHIFFINGFFTNYFNSILGVEWTIFVEVSFYIILPLLYVYRKYLLQITVFFLLLALMGFMASKIINFTELERIQLYFSPIIWFVVFTFGGLIYKYHNNNLIKSISIKYKSPIVIVLVLAFIVLSYVKITGTALIFSFILGLFFILNSYNHIFIFNNIILKKIGKLSFSIYLIHFPIIGYIKNNFIGGVMVFENQILNYILLCSLVFIVVLILSVITYRFVEQPFIELGKKLINKEVLK